MVTILVHVRGDSTQFLYNNSIHNALLTSRRHFPKLSYIQWGRIHSWAEIFCWTRHNLTELRDFCDKMLILLPLITCPFLYKLGECHHLIVGIIDYDLSTWGKFTVRDKIKIFTVSMIDCYFFILSSLLTTDSLMDSFKLSGKVWRDWMNNNL